MGHQQAPTQDPTSPAAGAIDSSEQVAPNTEARLLDLNEIRATAGGPSIQNDTE